MRQRPVSVQIDELVLTGFERVDAERVASAARRELGRLVELGADPWPAVGSVPGVLHAAGFRARPGSPPELIGTEVGRAVYRRLAG